METKPKGVIAIFTTPKGKVVATAPVFEEVNDAGWTMQRAQESLAGRRLAYEVSRAYCAPDYADSIGEYDREKIMNAMRQKGFKVSYVSVGYEDEDGNEVPV